MTKLHNYLPYKNSHHQMPFTNNMFDNLLYIKYCHFDSILYHRHCSGADECLKTTAEITNTCIALLAQKHSNHCQILKYSSDNNLTLICQKFITKTDVYLNNNNNTSRVGCDELKQTIHHNTMLAYLKCAVRMESTARST